MDGEIKPLWKHQSHAVEMARTRNCLAIFFDVGTGKTRTTIEILRERYNENKRILRTLILCPLIVMRNWKDEFLKFSKIPSDRIVILEGTKSERLSAFLEEPQEKIYILNYEGLQMKELHSLITNWGPEILVCDESHKLKSYTAKRTKLVIDLASFTKYRYILSGTPITNSYLDLFSQFKVLDGGQSFGDNYYAFRARYFWNANSNPTSFKQNFPLWKVRKGAEKDIISILEKNALRVKKEECLDLPPLIKQTLAVELSPQQRQVYEEMKSDFITFLNQKAVTAQIALTKALRLQQIVTGFAMTEEGEQITIEENPRLAALEELLEEITPSHKVIVWACFKQNYNQIREICERLKIKYVEAHGEIRAERKFESVRNFNEDPSVRVFIGNQGSLGVGINLIAASYSIYYSRNFNAEHDWQSESRNHRSGSEIHDKIIRIDLVARKTLDEQIAKALDTKTEISESVLRALALS